MSDVSAQQDDFYERELPPIANAAWVLTLLVVLIGVAGWEYAMRGLGLVTWDIGDGPGQWAVERRKIDAGDVDVAIIGASRILFDTDLDVFEDVTGIRPVQLALAGTNARSFLTDLADDEDFNGLLIVGMTELVYFAPREVGLFEVALDYYRSETPSERFGHQLYIQLQKLFAFIDAEYTLTTLLARVGLPRRQGAFEPYDEVWKLATTESDRQTRMWKRIEAQGPLTEHARHAWVADWDHYKPVYFKGYAPDATAEAIIATRRDIEKIRARGGEVVFVRCPSSDFYWDTEREYLPRDQFYDRLIRETNALGLHFEDYASMQGLALPEWSHLSVDAARTFTRAYASELVARSPWLRAHLPERN